MGAKQHLYDSLPALRKVEPLRRRKVEGKVKHCSETEAVRNAARFLTLKHTSTHTL